MKVRIVKPNAEIRFAWESNKEVYLKSNTIEIDIEEILTEYIEQWALTNSLGIGNYLLSKPFSEYLQERIK